MRGGTTNAAPAATASRVARRRGSRRARKFIIRGLRARGDASRTDAESWALEDSSPQESEAIRRSEGDVPALRITVQPAPDAAIEGECWAQLITDACAGVV